MFASGHHSIARHLVGAFFSHNPGEIDIVLYALVIDHDHENQVLVNGGTQYMAA
jgi:hypothetical protein